MVPESPPLSVLVVEDSEDAAQSTAELLALCGHAVRVAACGGDALRAAAAQTPDVVILDIGLPDMSGWDVAARLRAGAVGKQPVVVAVTGYGAAGDRWRSADAGVDLHLVKPADPAALSALLDRVREYIRPSAPRRAGRWGSAGE
jgi:DNA-binding response OmpR family regulator